METKELQPIKDEVFTFVGHSYDVSKAVEILLARGIDVGHMIVADVERLVQRSNGSTITIGISVDWNFIHDDAELPDDDCCIDIRVPIICAYTPVGNFLPIDGWHRIAKAILKGVQELPAVCLTEQESKKIWL
jgi:hypothetical protein